MEYEYGLYVKPKYDTRGHLRPADRSKRAMRGYCMDTRLDALERAVDSKDWQAAAYHERRLSEIEGNETRDDFVIDDLERRLRLVQVQELGDTNGD